MSRGEPATSVLSAVIYRVNFTVFLLTVNLSYNGGVGAEDLNISYRAADTGAHWSPAPTIRITSTSMLSVSAVVELPQPDASAGRMEFKMSVMDAGSFETTPLLFTERVGNALSLVVHSLLPCQRTTHMNTNTH